MTVTMSPSWSRKCRHTGLCQSCWRWLSQHETTTSGGPLPWIAYARRTPSCPRQNLTSCSNGEDVGDLVGAGWATIAGEIVSPPGSVQLLVVENVAQRAAGQVTLEVVAKDLGDPRVLLRHRAGRVRADDHVRHVPEGRVLGRRLRVENVQRGAGQVSFLERTDECRLIHELGTTDVDQDGAALHRRDLAGADHPLGLRRVRGGEDEEVGLRQRVAQLVATEDPVDALHRCVRAPHASDTHVHPFSMARYFLADASKADDRERFSGELLAAVARPMLGLLLTLHSEVILREHEHGHEAEVGQRSRVYAARRRDDDAR